MRSEFQFIQHIKERFSLGRIGDDCAVLPKDSTNDQLITADLLIEDVDFRLSYADPYSIGHKALAVSLSDIAAMGGTPTWALLSIGIPERLWNSEFLDDFYTGWHSLATIFGVGLVGGDVSRSPDKLVIDSIVGGDVPIGTALSRSGAKRGDAIFVSGSLAAAAAGLKLLEEGVIKSEANEFEELSIKRQLRPTPQIDLAKHLMVLQITTSAIDISDGLASDLVHICEASNCGAILIAESIPVDPSVKKIYPNESLELALNGGEDLELLFTVSADDIPKLADLPVTQIGSITSETGRLEIIKNGVVETLAASGFRHF